ncbi:MAG: High-affnity carbon uptake protein Hat/HatR, partial [Myxococcales bacterium]|nr:High-affnity carbon uptake protein Hat/HatR [Myxococcales bacterium]
GTMGFSGVLGPENAIVMAGYALWRVPLNGAPPQQVGAWKEPLTCFEVAPNGRSALVGHGGILTLISFPAGVPLHEWNEPCLRGDMFSFSDDGRRIGVRCQGTVRVLDTVSHAVMRIPFPTAELGKGPGAYAAQIAPDGNRVAIAGPDDAVRVWDLADGSLRIVGRHYALATSARFMPSSDRIVSGGRDRTLRIWHLDGTLERVIAAGDNVSPDSVHFTRDGRFFSASGIGNSIRLWRTPDAVVMHPVYDGMWMAQSADGRSLLHATYSGLLTLFDSHTGAVPAARIANVSLLGATLSPDGRYAMYWTNASSATNELGIWDTSTAIPKRIAVKSPVATAAFAPDNSRIVALHKNGDVNTWTLEGELVATTALPAATSTSSTAHTASRRIAFAERGLAVISDGSASVHVFDWSRSQLVRSINLGGGRVTAMALSTDGHALVVAGSDRQIRVVRLDTEGSVRTVATLSAAPKAMALTPDGATAAVALEDGSVVVIDVATGAVRATLPRVDVVGDLTFSRDGRWLATASIDSAARLWSTSDWTLQRLFAHDQSGGVRNVQFSVDGERLFWTGHEIGLGSGRVPAKPDVPATPEKLLGWIAEQTSAVATPGHSLASP